MTLQAPANADPATGVYWAQEARVPLASAAAMSAPVALQLTPRTRSGHAWLLDAWSYAASAATGSAPSVARFEVGAGGRASEAKPGRATVPVKVFGQLNENAEVYYYAPGVESGPTEGTFSIPAGSSSVEVELPVQVNLIGFKGAVATRLVEFAAVP